MYKPTLGRFLSRDPLNANGVDVLDPEPDLNEYAYTRNNPVNYVDLGTSDESDASDVENVSQWTMQFQSGYQAKSQPTTPPDWLPADLLEGTITGLQSVACGNASILVAATPLIVTPIRMADWLTRVRCDAAFRVAGIPGNFPVGGIARNTSWDLCAPLGLCCRINSKFTFARTTPVNKVVTIDQVILQLIGMPIVGKPALGCKIRIKTTIISVGSLQIGSCQ
jgi:hypothetical protein